uniref:X8 domain-containing protein n=1 Tax=Aegilops tauschii subsp. strangulata TaxID=200361 RepID=A0A453RZX1_AEGTS
AHTASMNYETVAHKTAAQTSAYRLLLCILTYSIEKTVSCVLSFGHKKEMGSGSTTVRLMAFASALVLLTHCIHAAAAPSFQQKQVRATLLTAYQHLSSSALQLLIVLLLLADPQAAAKTWCVAKPSTGEAALRANLEFACSESDCSAIQGTGGCSAHNGGVLLSRASVAMNAYYQARGRNTWNCFFNATGIISITDPSLGTCKYA